MSIADIDAQIAELEKKKRDLIAEEKKTALKKVELALQELNALGYNYKLAEEGAAPKRRSGVREGVLSIIQQANGIKPADIAATLDMLDKAGKQSVSNAVSALKKTGKITSTDGKYYAV